MNATEYLEKHLPWDGITPIGISTYEIVQLLEEYHQLKSKEELPTEEEIHEILVGHIGEDWSALADASEAIINLLKRE